MSQTQNNFTQPSHPLLLIPGPIEFTDEVLGSMAHYSVGHTSAQFCEVFGETLELLRKVFVTEKGQPLVVAGSGTLGWDMVAANFTEKDDDVLVISTGYFGDSFAECFKAYGAHPTVLHSAEPGDRPSLEEIKIILQSKKFKLVTITHVDTSTAVRNDVKGIAKLVRDVSPETLVVVDGVCSVGCEEIHFDEWDLDIVHTASQKALAAPVGLCVSMISPRALKVWESRKTPVAAYYINLKNWLPIMKNYEARKPSYFATPAVHLIFALNTSIKSFANDMEGRFKAHKESSLKVRKVVKELNLKLVPKDPEFAANGMSAIYLPEKVELSDVLPKLLNAGVVFAGGLHKMIATKYFRIGHMGITATDPSNGQLDKALDELKKVFQALQSKL